MILSFHPCIVGDLQIILGSRGLEASDIKSIKKADAVILPQACPKKLWEICSQNCPNLFPNYSLRYRYEGKIGQAKLFKELQVPHPTTRIWESMVHYEEGMHRSGTPPHPFPFYLKANASHEGSGVFFVEGAEAHKRALGVLKQYEKSGQRGFVSQEAIDCGGRVLRAVIIGKKIITYWKCALDESQKIITISRGAKIDVWWRRDLQKKAETKVRAFSRLTGINLGALDLLFEVKDQSSVPLFLEINYYFGRRGLGDSEAFYRLLLEGVREWLRDLGLDSKRVRLA